MSFSCPLEMEVVKCESIYSNIWLRFCYEYETTFESDINKRENNQYWLVDDFCRKCRSGGFNNHRRDRPASFFALTENHTWGLIWKYSTKFVLQTIFPGFCTMLMRSSFIRAKFHKQDLSSSLLQIPNEIRKLRFLEHFFVLTCPWLGTSTPLPPAFPPMRSPVSRPPEHHQYQCQHQHPSSWTSTKLICPYSWKLVSMLF